MVETQKYDTDALMWSVGQCLVNDFSSVLNTRVFDRMRNITPYAYRLLSWPAKSSLPAYPFKIQYQLESIFKRYRFRSDLYSDSELLAVSRQKFIDTQIRIGAPRMLRSSLTHPVIQRARIHAKAILGRYDECEHIERCKFGSKSTVGNTLANSYLDVKVGEGGPISGSEEHEAWFRNYADGRILNHLGPNFGPTCHSLPLVFVPKSFKALRSIMPNTTLGGFYSYGLGVLIGDRLAAAGLDIRTRQEKHRNWIKRYSKDRSHATADLSAASDSFRPELINMLVPREWYRALKLGRIRYFNEPGSGDSQQYLVSFMTMGIGFTFQLQTLLFYCLLLAIKELLSLRGRVSAYGDDLIYPSPMHKHVEKVFSQLDFILNIDKTYVHDPFRESCGSDCCRGVDVRPFQPEGSTQELARLPYLSLLYKTANGLLLRWNKEEIPITLLFLYKEMTRVTSRLHIVPMDFPAGSGLQVRDPREILNPYIQQYEVGYDSGIMGFRFHFLHQAPRRRITTDHWIYLWDSLRRSTCTEKRGHNWSFLSTLLVRKDRKILANTHGLGSIYEQAPDVIGWFRDKKGHKVCVRWGPRWKYYTERLVPFLPKRGELGSPKDQIGTTSKWTVDRTM